MPGDASRPQLCKKAFGGPVSIRKVIQVHRQITEYGKRRIRYETLAVTDEQRVMHWQEDIVFWKQYADPRKPLSDDRVRAMLVGSGIEIARRTVAKYREQMRILPACSRRQWQ